MVPLRSGHSVSRTNEPDFVLEPGYMQMIAVVCNRAGAAGFRLERPLVITETGNEVLSKLPIEPGVIECDTGMVFRDTERDTYHDS